MTRKHFRLLAEALRDVKPSYTVGTPEYFASLEQWQRAIGAVCKVGRQLNPAFNERVFRVACGDSG